MTVGRLVAGGTLVAGVVTGLGTVVLGATDVVDDDEVVVV